jgi:uncharacterized membrane protein
MATLSVFGFTSAEGADSALASLARLQYHRGSTILDAAVVTWANGRSRPLTRQAPPGVGSSALDGVFWGMLFGLIFFVPVLVEPFGAPASTVNGLLSDVGIDDNFIYHVRSKITEGHSALFILSSDSVIDWTLEASKEAKPQIIATHLPSDSETKLRNLFAKTTSGASPTCAR